MKHTIVIFDRDRAYANKAAGYINNRSGFPFEVIAVSGQEELPESTRRLGVDIALVDEKLLDEGMEYTGDECIILSDTGSKDSGGRRVLYKYQSYENIIREILLYASGRESLKGIVSRKSRMKLIGMFSPVGRSGQTSLGLAIGQNLAKNHRTLFVSMDCYSGLDRWLRIGFEGDLSDMLYAMDNDSKDMATLIGGVSGSVNGLDIMPPMERQGDLISIGMKEWRQLLKNLESKTDYEFIILDMSKAVQGLTELIGMCSRLIVTTLPEAGEQDKLAVFKSELEEIEELKEHIHYVKVPYSQDTGRDPMAYGVSGELGECAKEIVKEIVA